MMQTISGFFLLPNIIPPWVIWIYYLSYLKYSLEVKFQVFYNYYDLKYNQLFLFFLNRLYMKINLKEYLFRVLEIY